MPPESPSFRSPPGSHPVGAERDRVDGRNLEAGVVEARMSRCDEPEHVVVTGTRVQERDAVMVDHVADSQAKHADVEGGHRGRPGGKEQRVPEPPGADVVRNLKPGRLAEDRKSVVEGKSV